MVNRNQTAIFPMVRTTFLTAPNFVDVLVVKPHVVSANRAFLMLNKSPAAPSTITPAVTGLTEAPVDGSN